MNTKNFSLFMNALQIFDVTKNQIRIVYLYEHADADIDSVSVAMFKCYTFFRCLPCSLDTYIHMLFMYVCVYLFRLSNTQQTNEKNNSVYFCLSLNIYIKILHWARVKKIAFVCARICVVYSYFLVLF